MMTALRCLRVLLPLRTHIEQFEQHRIAFAFEFFDRAAARFLQYTINDRFLDLRTELGDCSEIFPLGGKWAGELFHEMLNPALTALAVK